MNDEFMHQFYEEPHAEFADALYERISREPQSRFAQTLVKKLTFRNAAIAFALLFLAAACVYAVVDRPRWVKVGAIWIQVQRTYKIDFTPPAGVKPSSEQPQTPPEEPECMSVEDARKILRFELRVPTWAPARVSFDNQVCGIDRLSDLASLYWAGKDPYSGINLMLSNRRGFNMSTQEYEIWPAAVWVPVAPGSYEEVQIHGQPAVLVRGMWEGGYWRTEEEMQGEKELKWDKDEALQLYWLEGEVLYELYTTADVSAEDLVRMAESTR
jgi:hypothetical protein